jgi:hypothetical protein
MLWVFILLFGAMWVLGSPFFHRWFWTIVYAGGVGSLVSLVLYGIMTKLRNDAEERERRAAEVLAAAERPAGGARKDEKG